MDEEKKVLMFEGSDDLKDETEAGGPSLLGLDLLGLTKSKEDTKLSTSSIKTIANSTVLTTITPPAPPVPPPLPYTQFLTFNGT